MLKTENPWKVTFFLLSLVLLGCHYPDFEFHKKKGLPTMNRKGLEKSEWSWPWYSNEQWKVKSWLIDLFLGVKNCPMGIAYDIKHDKYWNHRFFPMFFPHGFTHPDQHQSRSPSRPPSCWYVIHNSDWVHRIFGGGNPSFLGWFFWGPRISWVDECCCFFWIYM